MKNRAATTAVAAIGFCLISVLAFLGGRSIDQPRIEIDGDEADMPTLGDQDPLLSAGNGETAAPDADADADKKVGATGARASQGRKPAFERIAPRPPLSELSLAQPPKPNAPDKWKRITLFQPVAQSAGLIEAKGYKVVISGIDPLEIGQTCSFEGKEWACGARARTAFRAFLRGRAPSCVLPPEPGPQIVEAECQVGNKDLSEWLVLQGWARAREGGPYVASEAEAREHKRGMFGAPPADPTLVGATMQVPEISVQTGIEEAQPDAPSPSIEQIGPPADGGADPTLQAFPPAPSQ